MRARKNPPFRVGFFGWSTDTVLLAAVRTDTVGDAHGVCERLVAETAPANLAAVRLCCAVHVSQQQRPPCLATLGGHVQVLVRRLTREEPDTGPLARLADGHPEKVHDAVARPRDRVVPGGDRAAGVGAGVHGVPLSALADSQSLVTDAGYVKRSRRYGANSAARCVAPCAL